MVRSFRPTDPKWIPGTVVRPTGPLSYVVRVDPGIEWKHHVDDIRETITTEQRDTDLQPSSTEPEPGFEIPYSGDSNTSTDDQGVSLESGTIDNAPVVKSTRRYPTRIRGKPDRYM